MNKLREINHIASVSAMLKSGQSRDRQPLSTAGGRGSRPSPRRSVGSCLEVFLVTVAMGSLTFLLAFFVDMEFSILL